MIQTDYDKQAEEFLTKTGTTFEVKFLRHDKYFPADTDTRDVYEITLTRGDRKYSFEFGQCIAHSGRFLKYGNYQRGVSNGTPSKKHGKKFPDGIFLPPKDSAAGMREWERNPDWGIPTAYSVLACLEKYCVGSFDDWCSELGYDTDSRQAERTYKEVKEQHNQLKMIYSDSELELMAEIN